MKVISENTGLGHDRSGLSGLTRRSALSTVSWRAATVLTAVLVACDDPPPSEVVKCPDTGSCPPRSSVIFSTPLLEPKRYTIVAEADSERVECVVRFPAPYECVSKCLPSSAGIELNMSCVPLAIRGVRTTSSPSKLTITIERDGQQVVSKTFNPAYGVYEFAPGCHDCIGSPELRMEVP